MMSLIDIEKELDKNSPFVKKLNLIQTEKKFYLLLKAFLKQTNENV